jgi:hypothetical protein
MVAVHRQRFKVCLLLDLQSNELDECLLSNQGNFIIHDCITDAISESVHVFVVKLDWVLSYKDVPKTLQVLHLEHFILPFNKSTDQLEALSNVVLVELLLKELLQFTDVIDLFLFHVWEAVILHIVHVCT